MKWKTVFCLVFALVAAAAFPAGAEEPPKPKTPILNAVVAGNNRFATDLYARLAKKEDGNLLLSPYSISTALAMTYAGAKGETEAEMAGVLHFTLPQKRLHSGFAALISQLSDPKTKRPYQLSVANRLWGQKGYRFLKPFLDATRENYGAGLKEVDFIRNTEGARLTINRWVEEKTQEKIKDLLAKGVLNRLTRLVLTNAIYFKGNWKTQFDEKNTREAPFAVKPGEKISVPMMHIEARFKFAQLPDLQVLEMPYSGDDLTMLVLLPKEVDGLAELEKALTVGKLKEWTGRLRTRKVSVFLPKFTMTCKFELNKVLAAMGMPQAFDGRANFSGMNGRKDLFISAVIHKAFVDVNEEGTEAAAATAVVVMERITSLPPPVPVFRADHPFVFLLRDNRSGSILFIGRVVNPKKAKK